MNEQLLQLVNTCIQLLQTAQKEVPLDKLPKEWWIQLGAVYNTYRYEVQNNPDSVKQQAIIPPQSEEDKQENENNS